MKKILIFTFVVSLCQGFLHSAETSTTLFHSPQGQFDFSFQPQERRLYVTPYERAVAPGTKTQIYSISFFLRGQSVAVAVMYFTDIQTSKSDQFPTPLTQLVKGMLWSPQEDFVVLPLEAWPRVSGEFIPRQAVSLRTGSIWKYVDFPLQGEKLVWLNPMQVIGDRVDGCRREVLEFDGGSGRASAYQGADPPVGYEILSTDKEAVILKKVLGSCATEQDRRSFRADCIIMNVSFGRRQLGQCPP